METNKYLSKILASAGVGESGKRTPVKIAGLGDVQWHLQPYSGAEESLIEEYVIRNASIKDVSADTLRDAIRSTAEIIKEEEIDNIDAPSESERKAAEERASMRINKSALIVQMSLNSQPLVDSNRSAALIYYAAKNPLGQLLFKPADAKSKSDDFDAIDQLKQIPAEVRQKIVSTYLEKHCVSPLIKAVNEGLSDQLQDELEKKSEATPAGE